MTKQLAESICALYQIGTLIEDPHPISGGLIHKMWRVKTDRGVFAVKELNENIMSKPGIQTSFQLSEEIAQLFADQQIPAVTSLSINNQHIQNIDTIFVIVYPWIDGKILPITAAAPAQAQIIGQIIGKIHKANLQPTANMNQAGLPTFTNQHFEDLLTKFKQQFPNESAMLTLAQILAWNSDADAINAQLQTNIVVSHGDIDQKNVLWTESNQPMIIDWESVGLVNPGLEIVDAAFNWSGLVSGTIELAIFEAILTGYREEMPFPAIEPIYLQGIVIKWLAWLEFNLQKAANSADLQAKKVALAQIKTTWAILNLTSTLQIQTLK